MIEVLVKDVQGKRHLIRCKGKFGDKMVKDILLGGYYLDLTGYAYPLEVEQGKKLKYDVDDLAEAVFFQDGEEIDSLSFSEYVYLAVRGSLNGLREIEAYKTPESATSVLKGHSDGHVVPMRLYAENQLDVMK